MLILQQTIEKRDTEILELQQNNSNDANNNESQNLHQKFSNDEAQKIQDAVLLL